jgi:type IV fimbrial biogenesis protein FimT
MRTHIKFPNSGFTMIELMVVVAILAVMASLAAPSFQGLLAGQRVRSAAFSIVSDLTLARSEAVKRSANVTITPVATQWVNGWRVTVASSAEVLSSQSGVGNGVAFTTSPTDVTFDRNGRSSAVSTVRFQLSDGGVYKRCISIDPSGRPKSVATECPA